MSREWHEHVGYGLRIRSQIRLASLSGDGPATDRLTIVVDERPAVDEGEPVTRVGLQARWRDDAGRLVIRLGEPPAPSAVLRVDADGQRIEVAACPSPPDFTPLAPLVETTGLASALLMRSVPLLHASAVAVDGCAVLLAGRSGAGKSSLAAALVAGGHRLVTDDLAAITLTDPVPVIRPGSARLRVSPAVASVLGWDPRQLEPVFADELGSDKLALGPGPAAARATAPVPIRTVLILRRNPQATAPSLTPLTGARAAAALASVAYPAPGTDAPPLQPWIALSWAVPVAVLTIGDDLGQLPRVAEFLH